MIDSKGFKKYRNKIKKIINNDDNILLGDFTFYYNKKRKGIIMTNFVTLYIFPVKEKINKMFNIFITNEVNNQTKKIKKIDLGKLK